MSLTDEEMKVFHEIVCKADEQELEQLLSIVNREIYLESCAKQYASDEE